MSNPDSSVLTPFADGVWLHQHIMKLVPGASMPCQTTLLRSAPGELVCVSPGPFSASDVEAISALGTVTWLVAPNLFHHLHLRPAQQAFAGSQIAAPEGLTQKRKTLTINADLAAVDLGEHIDIIAIDGEPGIQEFALYHRPSKTLVVTDLIFNLQKPAGFLSPLLFHMMGTYNRLAASRLVKFMVKDNAAFKASVRSLLDRDIEGLIMAHGQPITTGGNDALRSAIEVRFVPL
jgi:hypothetical protein